MPYCAPANAGWISWNTDPVIHSDYINKQCNKGVFMFMFLPFLLTLSVAMGAINRKDKVSYILWAVLLIVTILSFIHHMTNSLTLSF